MFDLSFEIQRVIAGFLSLIFIGGWASLCYDKYQRGEIGDSDLLWRYRFHVFAAASLIMLSPTLCKLVSVLV